MPRGFTRLENQTDLAVLLALPNALIKPYLFLLSRARLKNPTAHWGEVAAAIGRGQTQAHNALRELVALGLAEEHGDGSWAALRPVAAVAAAPEAEPEQPETRRKPAGNPV